MREWHFVELSMNLVAAPLSGALWFQATEGILKSVIWHLKSVIAKVLDSVGRRSK